MKPGIESQTAVMVCMGRAIAHANPPTAAFSDPTASTLLPQKARQKVDDYLRDGPHGIWDHLKHARLAYLAKMMVPRTTAIDRAVRDAKSPQLVVLGAGLDGRAWRMPELRDTVVFEVDHPDSQKAKKGRIAGLKQAASEVRFAAVDFQQVGLAEGLDAAKHRSDARTTWIWEGVVMYLTQAQIEATLAVVQEKSAPGSRLVIAYHTPSPSLLLVGLATRRVGEPLRSSHSIEAMRALLARHRFKVLADENLVEVAEPLSHGLARSIRRMRHQRIVVAERLA